jgi:hypothetical protein
MNESEIDYTKIFNDPKNIVRRCLSRCQNDEHFEELGKKFAKAIEVNPAFAEIADWMRRKWTQRKLGGEMFPTFDGLEEIEKEVKAKFGKVDVSFKKISNNDQKRRGRFLGQMWWKGSLYIYNPADDSLTREDVVEWFANRRI